MVSAIEVDAVDSIFLDIGEEDQTPLVIERQRDAIPHDVFRLDTRIRRVQVVFVR